MVPANLAKIPRLLSDVECCEEMGIRTHIQFITDMKFCVMMSTMLNNFCLFVSPNFSLTIVKSLRTSCFDLLCSKAEVIDRILVAGPSRAHFNTFWLTKNVLALGSVSKLALNVVLQPLFSKSMLLVVVVDVVVVATVMKCALSCLVNILKDKY